MRDGDWKLVALHDKAWELYNITAEPTEMNDLSAKEPARAAELAKAWDEWAQRCNLTGKRTVKKKTAHGGRNRRV